MSMKHGFLIMFHNNIGQLKMLLDYLDHNNNVIVLGIDKYFHSRTTEELLKGFIKNATVVYIKLNIHWAGSSQISSTIEMLSEIEKYSCDYVHFITNADIPLMTKSYFDHFFEIHNGMNFIEYAAENYEFAKFKCEYFHFFVENRYYRKNKLLKGISHYIVKLQKLLKIKRSLGPLYHGSAYFSIKNDLVHYIIQNSSAIRNKYKYTLGADEVWLQSLVINSSFIDTVYNFEEPKANLRYIDWRRRNGNSPYLYRMSDKDELISVINTNYIFARKFDESIDDEIINEIYNQLDIEGNRYG